MGILNQSDQGFDVTDAGRLLLRLTIGGLMLFHGINKILHGNEQVQNVLAGVGAPVLFSYGVFLGEVLGPILVIIGYKTRIGAFLIAINMVIAILLVHSSQLMQLNPGGGWMIELNALYFFGAVVIMLLGSGRYAISKGHGLLD